MSRLFFIGMVCSILLVFSSSGWAGVTLDPSDNLKLEPNPLAEEPARALDILYIPSSYYEALLNSSKIDEPFRIEMRALFTAKNDRHQYSFYDYNQSDITKEVFKENNDYKIHGDIVTKDPIGNTFEFQVRPSKEQKDNISLRVSLPLISKYVYVDNNKENLTFYLQIYNKLKNTTGASLQFAIKPCQPELKDKLIDTDKRVELELYFRASVKYFLTTTSGSYEYAPSGEEKFVCQFDKPLNRVETSDDGVVVAAKFSPRLENRFAKRHLEGDERWVYWSLKRSCKAEYVQQALDKKKKENMKETAMQAVSVSSVSNSQNSSKREKQVQIEKSPAPKVDSIKVYNEKIIKGVMMYKSDGMLHIKVKSQQCLDDITEEIGRVYGKRKQSILALIVKSNHKPGSRFANQVKRTKKKPGAIKISGKYYMFNGVQPGLKFVVPESQLIQ